MKARPIYRLSIKTYFRFRDTQTGIQEMDIDIPCKNEAKKSVVVMLISIKTRH